MMKKLLCPNAIEYRNGMEAMIVCKLDDEQCNSKYSYWCPREKCMKMYTICSECPKLNK